MAKAVPVCVRLAKTPVDTEFLRKTLEVIHIGVIIGAVQKNCYTEQERGALCLAMQEKLPYHKKVENRTA